MKTLMFYCKNCKREFEHECGENERILANCPTCGIPGAYLHMSKEEWEQASIANIESAISSATNERPSQANTDQALLTEIREMHKKITFMFYVTIASICITVLACAVSYSYIQKVGKTIKSMTEYFSSTSDDSLYDYDYDTDDYDYDYDTDDYDYDLN